VTEGVCLKAWTNITAMLVKMHSAQVAGLLLVPFLC
jgi:hypothetical protein